MLLIFAESIRANSDLQDKGESIAGKARSYKVGLVALLRLRQ